RSWVVLPVAAWREAAPVFASAIENSGAGTGASGLEIKLEAGPARFTVLPSWSGDSPYFLVNDDLDARNSKRYVPLDPVAYRAACEKLLAAVKAAPPQPKPLDRLQELMNAQQKKSGEATGAATPETPPSAESPRTPTPTGPAVAE
ncbi:MAG TPA: hypothetical protein VGE52_00140, partial [Pirellulales bacterium]